MKSLTKIGTHGAILKLFLIVSLFDFILCQLSELPDVTFDNNVYETLVGNGDPVRETSRRRGFSLFPEPKSPYYGFLYDPKTASRFPIPASITGNCEKGKVYRIRSTDDFRKYQSELQCVFAAGVTPSQVPEGPQYGGVLLVLNSRHFLINPLVDFGWRGNMVFRAQCHNGRDDPTYIGYHNVLGRSVVPYILSVGILDANLAPGEYDDGRPSGIMDLTQDFSKACPNYANFVETNKTSLPTRSKTLANVYPFNQALDVLRIVGRQEDGGAIYLGKTYLQDYFRADKQAATIAFWYVVNYDLEVSTDFKVGQPLPPLEEGFKYTFPGVFDIIFRYLPIDNVISRPFHVLGKLKREIVNTGRASYQNFRELLRNIGQLRMNSRRIRNYFRDGRPNKRG